MKNKHVRDHVKHPVKFNFGFKFISKFSIFDNFFCTNYQLINKWNYYYLMSEDYNCEFIFKRYSLC